MITTIIFDLSEVLIRGIIGIEDELSPESGRTPEEIHECFDAEPFRDLME